MPYTHLTREDRIVIDVLLSQNYSIRKIAWFMGRSPSTVSREIRRNQNSRGEYDPHLAQYTDLGRRKRSIRSHKLGDRRLMSWVVQRLRRCWSPEQIAGRLRYLYPHNPKRWISHETIYRFIRTRAQRLRRYLRRGHKRYRKPGTPTPQRIRDRVGIEQRPEIVQQQGRFGDWEGDTIMGTKGKSRVLTLVERRSLYLVVHPMLNAGAATLNQAVLKGLAHVPKQLVHTITVDNGSEFSRFKELEEQLDAKVYFARPYAAWERGINENTNGLLRQFVPKGHSLRRVRADKLIGYANSLNNRPRKKLGYRTPAEVLREQAVALAS